MNSLLPDELDVQYSKVRAGVAAMWINRDILIVGGPDAAQYLQGQLTQSVDNIEEGATVWSFILQPHGKVDALVRVTRIDNESFAVDTDPGFGALVAERLERFKMRTKVDIARTEWQVLALRGPGAREAAQGQAGLHADAAWPGLDGIDLMGRDVELPKDVYLCNERIYETLRIESGMPRMGQEMDERTIPAEMNINDRVIDFKKGCYTGQELVARIDARGNHVPRLLRGVVLSGEYSPAKGSKIFASPAEQKGLGAVTSVAYSWHLGAPIGLAMVRRDVKPTAAAVVDDGGVFIECTIHELPLI